jgi:hypothetical protein
MGENMSDVLQQLPLAGPTDKEGYEAAWKQVMAEISRLNDLMQQDRIEIERLRDESLVLRTETRALLAGMGVSL